MSETVKKTKKKTNKNASLKEQNVNLNKENIKASANKNVDATFDVNNNETLNAMDTLNETKMMIQNEKQKLNEEYGIKEMNDDREIAFSNFENKNPKAKKTISIDDITNAINAAYLKEEMEKKKQEEKAKKIALKNKKKKMRAKKIAAFKKKLEENKKLKKEKIASGEIKTLKERTKDFFTSIKNLFNHENKEDKDLDKETKKKNKKEKKTKDKKEKKENSKVKENILTYLKNDKYFNKNTFLFIAFVVIFLFMFVCMLIPNNEEVSSRVKSNLVDTEEIEGIDKVKAEIENYIVKQFPFYEQILDGYFGTLELSNRKLYQNANDNELILLDSKDGIYIDAQGDQLIRKYEVEEKNQDLELGHRLKLYNEMAKVLKKKNVNAYIYAVSGIWTSEAILNFELDYKEPLKYVKLFEEKIDDYIHFDYLKIIDYTTFKEYFFATDHHWRIHGAYQGYKDVCKLLGVPNDQLVKPNFFKVEGVEFLGSNAKICSHDNIIDYLYDVEFDEKFKVDVNRGEMDEKDFSQRDEYLKGEFEKDDVYYNHYGKYFHSDLGEIVYTFDKNKKDNKRLLIISDSYSNCIDKLIASHFYKTYVIDLRYFESSIGEKFVLEDYVEENKITDCLVMLSANSVYFESADLDLGLDTKNETKK